MVIVVDKKDENSPFKHLLEKGNEKEELEEFEELAEFEEFGEFIELDEMSNLRKSQSGLPVNI